MTIKKTMMFLAALATVSFLATDVQPAFAAKNGAKAAAAAPSDSSGTVNLNTATEEELMLLPGVGPTKAQRIVEWRQKHGKFRKIEDLTKVKGFGYKTFKKLKPYLAVQGTTTYKGKSAPARGTAPPGDEQP
jgi:competence protein ComEA